jgi:biopolymer transport protein ExbD
MLDEAGKLKLNMTDAGTVSDPDQLRNKLRDIFKERENKGVFREGTNEVEKTVFLRMSPAGKYGNFMKLVETVKGAGAQPIGIQFDEVKLEDFQPDKPIRLR